METYSNNPGIFFVSEKEFKKITATCEYMLETNHPQTKIFQGMLLYGECLTKNSFYWEREEHEKFIQYLETNNFKF